MIEPLKLSGKDCVRMDLTKRERLFLLIACLLLFFIIWQLIGKRTGSEDLMYPMELQAEQMNERQDEEEEDAEWQAKIVIDVKGAVNVPGVYEMEVGDRVIDAIEAADGLLDNAEEKALNLAGLLQDEMVIYVPVHGEEVPHLNPVSGGEANNDEKVKINSASVEELQKLPGIGPAKAEAIATYRDENGAFKSVDDLLQVSGIGVKSLEKMIDKIDLR